MLSTARRGTSQTTVTWHFDTLARLCYDWGAQMAKGRGHRAMRHAQSAISQRGGHRWKNDCTAAALTA